LLCLILVLCLFIATDSYLKRRADYRALESKFTDLDARAKKMQDELAAKIKPAPIQRPTPNPQTGGPLAALPQSRSTLNVDFEAMRKDPRYASLWRKFQLQTMRRLYGIVIANMRLQPDQEAALYNLMVEREESSLDGYQTAKLAGLPQKDCDEARRAAEAAVNDQISALVGQENTNQLQLTDTWNVNQVQYSVGNDFAIAGCPLTPEQIYLLGQAYHTAQIRPFDNFVDPNDQTPDSQTGLTPDYQALLDRISPILSPTQISILRDHFLLRSQFQVFAHDSSVRSQ
jgi:hypothetical protein